MTKRKSIVGLVIALLLVLILAAFCIWPSFEIGINDFVAPAYSIKLGLDLKGGVYVTFDVERAAEVEEKDTDGNTVKTTVDDLYKYDKDLFISRVNATKKTMEERLAAKGYADAVVTVTGNENDRIKVEIPNITSREELLRIISKPAELIIRMDDPIEGDIAFDAKDILSSSLAYGDQSGTTFVIQLKLSNAGRDALSEATANCAAVPATIYFVLDGNPISQATVSEQFTGSTCAIPSISSYTDAVNYKVQIDSGAYEVSFKNNIYDFREIGASLGEGAVKTAVIAILAVIVIVMIFMIAAYGLMGAASALSILYYVVLMILALGFLPFAQLTLPGLAGVIIGFGLHIYANVIVFGRIRENFRSGKSREISISFGFKKSVTALVDSNIAVFAGSLAVYVLASGAITSLALTLMFSTVISMLATFGFVRLFMRWLDPLTANDSLFGLRGKAAAVNEKGGKTA